MVSKIIAICHSKANIDCSLRGEIAWIDFTSGVLQSYFISRFQGRYSKFRKLPNQPLRPNFNHDIGRVVDGHWFEEFQTVFVFSVDLCDGRIGLGLGEGDDDQLLVLVLLNAAADLILVVVVFLGMLNADDLVFRNLGTAETLKQNQWKLISEAEISRLVLNDRDSVGAVEHKPHLAEILGSNSAGYLILSTSQ